MTRSALVSAAAAAWQACAPSGSAALPPHALLTRCEACCLRPPRPAACSVLQQRAWLHVHPAQGQRGLRHPARALGPEHVPAGKPVRHHARLRGLCVQGCHLQRGLAEEGPQIAPGPLVGHVPWPLRRHVCKASRCAPAWFAPSFCHATCSGKRMLMHGQRLLCVTAPVCPHPPCRSKPACMHGGAGPDVLLVLLAPGQPCHVPAHWHSLQGDWRGCPPLVGERRRRRCSPAPLPLQARLKLSLSL